MSEIQYDGGAQKVSYAYDAIGRVSSRVAECGADAGKLTSSYSYVDGGFGTNSTTPLVKKITQNGISFEYEYDSRGNIISEKRGNLTTTYAYDALGQLIRVNDPHENATWVYSYDRGGNILSKAKYAYTTGALGAAVETIPYTYGDSNWKDKLTAYNGTAITYDAIGNSLNDGAWTYEWQTGRQLKKMTREGQTLTFKYDHNGMRIQKVLEHDWYPETTKYTYHGKLLTHMTVDYHDWDEVTQQDKLHFFYDAQSRPAKVVYNGVIYTYVQNLQGDIVGMLDSAGTLVVEYKYDAWGKLLGVTGSLADTLGVRNPFRYRGYIYDGESELYYLRSRYFTPVVGRFVNADTYCGTIGAMCSHSSYTYCNNTPVVRCDNSGYSSVSVQNYELLAGLGILGGLIAVALYLISSNSLNARQRNYSSNQSYVWIGDAKQSSSHFGGAKREPAIDALPPTRGGGAGRHRIQNVASEIDRIASRFGVFKCKDAANAIRKYLEESNKHGSIIQIQYPCGMGYPGYIVSDIYGGEAISTNGVHQGVLYEGNVYCNVHPYGLPKAEWIADFHGFPESMKKVTCFDF